MNTKHTPGPWRIEGNEVHAYATAVAVICETVQGEDGSNARLIAAAPDLLAALQRLITALGGQGALRYELTVKTARAAIAKAEGGV